MRKIYSALDIGSNTIKLVVGEFINNKLNILCALEESCRGFKRNEIVNPDELIRCIKELIDKVSVRINLKVKRVILNIPSNYTNFIVTEATNTITNDEFTVSGADILRVLQSSAYNRVSSSEELIGVIPVMFKVGDNETNEPFGKKGKNISVKSVLITSDKKGVYDLINLLGKCSIDVIDITCNGIADYYAFKNETLDSGVGIMVNLGDTSTTLNVINKGIFINNDVISTGGYDICKDIAYVYNLKKREANYLKENLALASTRNADAKESATVVNKLGEEVTINQYEVTEVVSSRLDEILKLVKKSINHLTKKEISYIIITGGLTELSDFAVLLDSIFGDNVKIGKINSIGARNNKYCTAIGMLYYFNSKLSLRRKDYSTLSDSEVELMCNGENKSVIASDSILGKVFGYFFDN